jgi:hypothetical protein
MTIIAFNLMHGQLISLKQRSSYVDIEERETCSNTLYEYIRKWRKKTHFENVKAMHFFQLHLKILIQDTFASGYCNDCGNEYYSNKWWKNDLKICCI